MNTWTGDADLSGTIDGDDYFQIDSGYVAHDTGYARGDFNFDGKINADDYFIIDKSYAKRLGMLGAAPLAGLTVVPEPGSGCAMIAAACAGLMLRRRRDSAAAARALFLQ
jgi:hypothetical protein